MNGIKKNKNNIVYEEYKNYLEEIGYLKPEGPSFSIETANTDPEIASICGHSLLCQLLMLDMH